MIVRSSFCSAVILVLVALAFLLACFPGSTVCADGAGGQWPAQSSTEPDGASDGDTGDAIVTIITIAVTLQLIL
jgi:hypothetical protein